MAEQASETAQWSGIPHGTFCWTEIASSDAQKCKAFYTDIFGWKFQDSNAVTDGFAYHEYSTGGDYPAGGLYEITPEMSKGEPLPPPHFMTYVAVDDVDDNAKLAIELGATIVHGPTDVPNVGRICVIRDPQGAMISTFRMKN